MDTLYLFDIYKIDILYIHEIITQLITQKPTPDGVSLYFSYSSDLSYNVSSSCEKSTPFI